MRGVDTRFHSRFHSKADNGADPWGITPLAPGCNSQSSCFVGPLSAGDGPFLSKNSARYYSVPCDDHPNIL